jgi:Zn-dependent protease
MNPTTTTTPTSTPDQGGLRVAGFRVRVGWGAAAIAALLGWSLATGAFPAWYPGHPGGAYWTAGLVTAGLFLASVLAHELGHALVARRAGLRVADITLWILGGVARIHGDAPTPGAALRIAAVGPLVSLGLALGFGLAAVALAVLGSGGLVAGVLVWLAGMNALLAAFNLLPGAPLDGGRVLRALLWRRHGDPVRAAVTAARAGQAIGVGLVAVGLAQLFLGGGTGGVWNALIGWFVLNAARAEGRQAELERGLGHLRVGDVMLPDPPVGPAWFTVEAFLASHGQRYRLRAFPVVEFDGRPGGMVTLAALLRVPPERRPAVRVGAVALPPAEVVTAGPGEPVPALVTRLAARGQEWALVVDGERLVGLVSPDDLARAAQLGRAAGPAPAPAGAGR